MSYGTAPGVSVAGNMESRTNKPPDDPPPDTSPPRLTLILTLTLISGVLSGVVVREVLYPDTGNMKHCIVAQ